MITRGIIEKLIDTYHVKVRIPSLDRVGTSNVYTSTDNLNTAVFATLPGCEVHLQPGDVVVISVDPDEMNNNIILGYLYRAEAINKHCGHHASYLTVDEFATLPSNTEIGSVSANEILCLQGINENIQKQLDDIKHRLMLLEEP